MTLDEIYDEFEKDSKFDRTELGDESLKIARLHAKYFRMFSNERLRLKSMQQKYNELYKAKYEYYMGTLSEEEYQLRGWEPNPLRILKSDVPMYIDSDSDLGAISIKIEYQKEKITALEGIIKHLNARGFQIKAAIDWEKFKAGI